MALVQSLVKNSAARRLTSLRLPSKPRSFSPLSSRQPSRPFHPAFRHSSSSLCFSSTLLPIFSRPEFSNEPKAKPIKRRFATKPEVPLTSERYPSVKVGEISILLSSKRCPFLTPLTKEHTILINLNVCLIIRGLL